MKTVFTMERLKSKTIQVLDNAWSLQNYKELLDIMEYGDTSGLELEDAKDLCLMSLTDYEPEEACSLVLNYVLGEQLNEGQINNLSHEMQEEKMWEEYADVSLHESFFNVGRLLYHAYNGKFPHPEAVYFQFKVSAKKAFELNLFDTEVEEALVRLLAQGMPANSKINRLYPEELQGADFPEAKDIIWQYKKSATEENSLIFDVISSLYWFEELKYIETFEATAELQ